MKSFSDIHNLKSIRLKDNNYSHAGYYFVTICVKDRLQLFGKIVDGIIELSEIGEIVNECLRNIQQHFSNSLVDYFCIMPNHLHLIVIINDSGNVGNRHACSLLSNDQKRNHQTLPVIIGSFKSAVTKLVHRSSSNINNIWQKSYYEHIIRNEKELFEIRKYIEFNPLNWKDDEYNE